uniref:Uncharacterized protein n=1 Tax=Hyaloperonospora arabidopsidis (strain Emoy2) TaxID=559515 RepID=M4C2K5_HYAAE
MQAASRCPFMHALPTARAALLPNISQLAKMCPHMSSVMSAASAGRSKTSQTHATSTTSLATLQRLAALKKKMQEPKLRHRGSSQSYSSVVARFPTTSTCPKRWEGFHPPSQEGFAQTVEQSNGKAGTRVYRIGTQKWQSFHVAPPPENFWAGPRKGEGWVP